MDVDSPEVMENHVNHHESNVSTAPNARQAPERRIVAGPEANDKGEDYTLELRAVKDIITELRSELHDALVELHVTKTKVAALEREAEISRCAVSSKLMEGEKLKKELTDLTAMVQNLMVGNQSSVYRPPALRRNTSPGHAVASTVPSLRPYLISTPITTNGIVRPTESIQPACLYTEAGTAAQPDAVMGSDHLTETGTIDVEAVLDVANGKNSTEVPMRSPTTVEKPITCSGNTNKGVLFFAQIYDVIAYPCYDLFY